MPDERSGTPGVAGPGDGLGGVYALLQQQLSESRQNMSTLAELRADVHSLKGDASELSRMLRGDGSPKDPGLSTRMVRIEDKVESLSGKVESVDRRLEARGIATETGRWSMAQAVIVAILTGIFLLGVAVVSGVFRGKP